MFEVKERISEDGEKELVFDMLDVTFEELVDVVGCKPDDSDEVKQEAVSTYLSELLERYLEQLEGEKENV